jgi:hypothetical protein
MGRLSFEIPGRWKVTARSSAIYLIEVWTTPAANAAERDEVWRRQLLPLREPAGAAAGPSIQRELSIPGVGSAVWYSDPARSERKRVLLAMKAAPQTAVLLQAKATAAREPAAEEVVRRVGTAYVPESRNGFCIGDGAVVMPPSLNERASVKLLSEHGVEVLLTSETVAAPVDDESAEAIEGAQVLTAHARSVAGLAGQETRVLLKHDGPGRLAYRWTYPGEVANALAPHVRVLLVAPVDQHASVDLVWQRMLDSLQARPVGAP